LGLKPEARKPGSFQNLMLEAEIGSAGCGVGKERGVLVWGEWEAQCDSLPLTKWGYAASLQEKPNFHGAGVPAGGMEVSGHQSSSARHTPL
jgi:hypothetical protein